MAGWNRHHGPILPFQVSWEQQKVVGKVKGWDLPWNWSRDDSSDGLPEVEAGYSTRTAQSISSSSPARSRSMIDDGESSSQTGVWGNHAGGARPVILAMALAPGSRLRPAGGLRRQPVP